MKRYTLTECYALLSVDPKTFRAWLVRDGMQTTQSKADPRVKYLTEEQVRFLAREHERTLPATPPIPETTIPKSTYKLLLDQVDDIEDHVADLASTQHRLREDLQQQQTQVQETLAALRDTFDGEIADTRELVDANYHQHEAVATLVNEQQRQLEQLYSTLTEQATTIQHIIETQHQQHESLATLVNEQRQQVDQLRDLIIQHDEQTQQRIQEVGMLFEERYQETQKALQTMNAHVRQQAEALHQQRTELEKMIEERLCGTTRAIEQVERDLTVDIATIHERMQKTRNQQEHISAQIEAARITALGAQSRADEQDQQIAAMKTHLQEERQARQALSEQVATLLARSTETRQRHKAGEKVE